MIAWPGGFLAASVGIMLAGGQPGAEAYHQLHYDYEVATHCGRVTADVERAFRSKRAAADAALHLDENARKAVRIHAYVRAAREYDNRSLGGHRNWCETDGAAGVERILEPANK